MPVFDTITVEGNAYVGGVVAGGLQAFGQVMQPAASTLDILTGTTHNAVLPGFAGRGPMLFPISGAGTPVLGGIQTLNGQNVQQGQVIVLANVGSVAINTSASDSGSSAGNQFSAAVDIPVGGAAAFVYVGEFFVPLFPSASS